MTSLPPDQPRPDARRLVRSTVLAAVAALAILVTVVLPAEYGIDPTRIGRVLGLTQMGVIKVRLAREAAADAAADAAAAEAESLTDTMAPAAPDTSADGAGRS